MRERSVQVQALRLPLDRLPDPLPIPVIEKPFDVAIRPPGSKSITNRALLLAALAEGVCVLRSPLVEADDARVMLRAIEQLGAKVDRDSDHLRITGVGGQWRVAPGANVSLNLNNAGTATRFLSAAAMLAPADSAGIVIDGDHRMRERPIRELADALGTLGVRIEFLGAPGYPPLRVHPITLAHSPPDSTRRASTGDVATVPPTLTFGTTASSQFISALLQVGPFLPKGLMIRFTGAITSPAYIAMTLAILQRLGVCVDVERGSHAAVGTVDQPERSWSSIRVRALTDRRLKAFEMDIEPDASGATYLHAAAALIPSARTKVVALDLVPQHAPLQGDTRFVSVLASAGAQVQRVEGAMRCTGPSRLTPFDVDLSNMPDTAMTAAVVACFAEPTSDNPSATSVLHGLRTLRVKETDRLAAIKAELTKVGALVEVFQETLHGEPDEGLRITPPTGGIAPASLSASQAASCPRVEFDTYNDHRMAMSLALIGLRRPSVFIRDPGCVRKTYPTYWADLARLYA